MPEAIRFIITNWGPDGYDEELAGLSCEISDGPCPRSQQIERLAIPVRRLLISAGDRSQVERIRCNVPLQPLRWSQIAIEVLL